jgi:cysteine-rich repeat protein
VGVKGWVPFRFAAARALRAFRPALVTVLCVSACRDPTQAKLVITTDALCSDVSDTTIHTGSLAELESVPPVAATKTCEDGAIGSLVVTPSGDDDAAFGVRVVTGLGKSAEDCEVDGYRGGCILARRFLHFIPHETLHLPISMDVSCLDVPCDATQTCRDGRCVPADVDPNECLDEQGCNVPGAGGGGGSAGTSGVAGGSSAGSSGAGGTPGSGGDGGSGGGGGGSGGSEGGTGGSEGGESGAGGAAGSGASGGVGGTGGVSAGGVSAGGDAGAGGAGGEAATLCGNGTLDDSEACDDDNTTSADGCTDCAIDPDWGCRNEPSECAPVTPFAGTNSDGDDFPDDLLRTLFESAAPDAESFLFVGVDAPPGHAVEYCLARADWYAERYLAYDAPYESYEEVSGSWEKWWRADGSAWSAPDTAGYTNYFGVGCLGPSGSFCPDWMLGGQLLAVLPTRTDEAEIWANDYTPLGETWSLELRIGTTRLAACGF